MTTSWGHASKREAQLPCWLHRRLGRGHRGTQSCSPWLWHMPCLFSATSHLRITPHTHLCRPAGSFVPKQKATKADLAPCPVNTFQQFTAQASCQVGPRLFPDRVKIIRLRARLAGCLVNDPPQA